MDKFAFLVHPLNLEHYSRTLHYSNFIFKRLPPYTIKSILLKLAPYQFVHLKNVRSQTGTEIEGYVIMCPLLPDQLAGNVHLGKKRILDACRIAQNLGAGIIGLGGFTSIITNGGKDLLDDVKIAVTSGNTYTATLVIDSLLRLLRLKKNDDGNSQLTVIGASGDIGSICSLYLSHYFQNLVLVGRNIEKLKELEAQIRLRKEKMNVEITSEVGRAIKTSDFIITATSSLTTIVDPSDLKEGAVLCDVAYPANINLQLASRRKDITVYEGGLAECRIFNNCRRNIIYKINLFNPGNTVHGCFAETMLLTFEKRFENYSIGKGRIPNERIDEMRDIAVKHGLKESHLREFG